MLAAPLPYLGAATVKPKVSKSGPVKISSSTLTIKQGSKTVAKDKTSAKVKAGTYSVKTTVKYKVKSKGTYGKTKTKSATQKLIITSARKNCATSADFAAIKTVDESEDFTGADIAEVEQLVASEGSAVGAMVLGVIDFVDYKVCNSAQLITVMYLDDEAFSKDLE